MFILLVCWSFYPKKITIHLAGSAFKASPSKLELLKYKLLNYGVVGSSRITFDSEVAFTYQSCSTSKPLIGKWHISNDTLFLEGEHRLFPILFLVKNEDKMIRKSRLKSGTLIEIMKRE